MIKIRDNWTHCVEGTGPYRSPRRVQIHGE